MPRITAIDPNPRREGQCEVTVEGCAFATVSLGTIDRLKLRVGLELGPEVEASIEREAAALKTYDRALNMLAFRARSARELERQLVRKGEEPGHVAVAIERLLAVGLLNDAEYARQFARAKVTGSGFSKRRIEAELFRKGVAREVVAAAIGDVLADEEVDEAGMLESVARKKLRTLGKLDPETKRRRLYAFLARRGYPSEEIRGVMGRVLGSEEGEE